MLGRYLELEFAVNATTFASIGAKAIDGISAETDIGMSGLALTAHVGVSVAF
ncbi:MAG: hypothetical protein H0S77_06405 [Spirochaetaceae bacterium]|uniref:hypothetical protein n=1 Tax=Sphaerochaeta halotolerans TaxID=2293840 RepID=UPI001403F235|nr:hypothetical protein [Sphaerochaeta halotolerans]MBG0767221.1 hypothetical protein [Spirochaetaceae bacterium]